MTVELPKNNNLTEIRAFALQMAVKSTGESMKYQPGEVIQTAQIYTHFLTSGKMLEDAPK